MKVLLPLVVGVLFGAGTYLMLKKNILKLVLGLGLISHGANVLLISSGWIGTGQVPILGQDGTEGFVDPVPQALVLTAIVIGFAALAFLLVLSIRVYRDLKTADISEIRGQRG
ncbi:MAG: sodium:proton antiporter [Nitrospira sp.]|nr:Na(+)/H(+) antiporter subunit C [Candidatus Manganitrophaceae bacterium]HIL34250.1 Na(+)/H(+) antiporter subunit C [Candidatus Manganitrophaceae bacterium]